MEKATILIVEDERIIARGLQVALSNLGYAVAGVVASGEEAIQSAHETHPDLVLMDIVLKGEIDGVEAADRIRADLGIPSIFITAYADEDVLMRARVTEAFGYILKPFEEQSLHANIQMALYKHQAERRLKQAEQALRTANEDLEERVAARTAELLEANLRLEQQIVERTRAEASLQQHAEELRILYALSQRVNASLSLDQVSETVLQGVLDSLAPDLAMLFLLRKDGLQLAGTLPEHPAWQRLVPALHRVGGCLCGLAIETRDPLYSRDIHADSRCTLDECKLVGMRSFAALPLTKGGEILGVLGLASCSDRDFRLKDSFLKALAANTAIGLQNALLHEKVQLDAAELERHVMQLARAQEAVRESEERYRLLFERNLAGVYRSSLDGRLLACNEALATVLGYESAQELLGVPASDLYADPDDRERFVIQLKAHGAITNQEWRLKRRDDKAVWCLESACLVEGTDDGQDVIQGTVVDITRRKLVEDALQESEARYRALFENAPLCLFEVDLSRSPHVILQANRRTEAVYGWSPSEITSTTISTLCGGVIPLNHQRLADVLLSRQPITFESTHQRRDGSPFPVRVSATPASESNAKHIVLAVEDISAEKSRRSEEEAIAEERRRLAREIHDGLAQNLASLRLRARLWHHVIDDSPQQMHDEVEVMRDFLSEQIREVRRSILALRPVALEQGFYPALRQLVDDLREQNQLRMELRVTGDADRLPRLLEPVLFRIVQEALNNVGKHAHATAVQVDLDLTRPDRLALMVVDNGQGFAPATLQDSPQLGHLGLAQMRERVEELGGTLRVQSQVEQGTEIQVILPIPQP